MARSNGLPRSAMYRMRSLPSASTSFATAPRSTSTLDSSSPSVVVSTARQVDVDASQYWARSRVPRMVERRDVETLTDAAARMSTGTVIVAVTSTVGREATGTDPTAMYLPSSEAVSTVPPRGAPPAVTDHELGERSERLPVQGSV